MRFPELYFNRSNCESNEDNDFDREKESSGIYRTNGVRSGHFLQVPWGPNRGQTNSTVLQGVRAGCTKKGKKILQSHSSVDS